MNSGAARLVDIICNFYVGNPRAGFGLQEWFRDNGGQCVEVAAITTHPNSPEPLRDSRDLEGPVLAFSPGHWRTFAGRVKAGTFRLA